MTKNNGTSITSFDLVHLHDELEKVTSIEERNKALIKYGYQGSDSGYISAKESIKLMEYYVNRYDELAARIYATGKPLYLCTMSMNVLRRNQIETIDELRSVLKQGERRRKEIRRCGKTVWKVWEEACSLTERA